MYVPIGGIDQWIQFGENQPNHPLLLYLHGGPGGTSLPAAAAWKPWEEYFTVVHWDQRGAGRTFGRNGETGCGSLGYNYRRQMEQAERLGNEEAARALRAIGPPPFPDRSCVKTLREWADRLAEGDGDSAQPRPSPRPTDFTADEVPMMMKGAEFSRSELYAELKAIDLPSLGLTFDVPIFFFEGTHDQQTPMELAERYFDAIEAPQKRFVRFEGCHHFVVMNRPDAFLRELLTHVRPLLDV
ncbi:MAG: alpha/beta fold hydrolase [Steroidobacteraceae bacterium]